MEDCTQQLQLTSAMECTKIKNKTHAPTCRDAETSLADPLQRGGGEVDAILQYTNHPHMGVVCAQLALVVGPGRAENVPMRGVQLQFDVGKAAPGAVGLKENVL